MLINDSNIKISFGKVVTMIEDVGDVVEINFGYLFAICIEGGFIWIFAFLFVSVGPRVFSFPYSITMIVMLHNVVAQSIYGGWWLKTMTCVVVCFMVIVLPHHLVSVSEMPHGFIPVSEVSGPAGVNTQMKAKTECTPMPGQSIITSLHYSFAMFD